MKGASPKASNKPPTAGPTMVAACQAVEFHVTALAKSRVGTRLTISEDEDGPRNARATPNSTRIASISQAVVMASELPGAA
jgi:hypothetical protein